MMKGVAFGFIWTRKLGYKFVVKFEPIELVSWRDQWSTFNLQSS